jgi:uncharacterized damage-inducible protein DinB
MIASAHDDLVVRLAAVPDRVAVLTAGLDDAALRRRPVEGEWSMKEVCGHLVEDARTWQERIALMTTQVDPYLARLDPVVSVREGGYQDAPIGATMDEFRRIRRQTVETLRGLSEDGWQRRGRHWSEGPMTIEQACSVALEHAESHIEQIERLVP